MPELENFPHDAIVAEFAQERNDAVLSPVAAARSPALRPNRKRAAARDERAEAENLLVRQPTVRRPTSAARADAGDHSFCFDERLVVEKLEHFTIKHHFLRIP